MNDFDEYMNICYPNQLISDVDRKIIRDYRGMFDEHVLTEKHDDENFVTKLRKMMEQKLPIANWGTQQGSVTKNTYTDKDTKK